MFEFAVSSHYPALMASIASIARTVILPLAPLQPAGDGEYVSNQTSDSARIWNLNQSQSKPDSAFNPDSIEPNQTRTRIGWCGRLPAAIALHMMRLWHDIEHNEGASPHADSRRNG
jgi:hypothetical protein